MAGLYSFVLESAAMPLVSTFTRSRFWHAWRQMRRLENASLDELQALQWRRFTELLEHAYTHVPFHRQRMDQANLNPADIASPADLVKFPVTTKAQIQRDFPDRVTADNINRSDWQYVSTRGTADRLMAIHDFHKRDMVRASAVRAMHYAGGYRLGNVSAEIPPNICNIVCGDEGQTLDGVMPHVWTMVKERKLRDRQSISDLRGLVERGWIFRRRTYPPFGMQGTALPDDKLAHYVQLIQRDRPVIMKALPTYLLQIARYVQRHKLAPLPVAAVKPMGSSVSPRMRELIQASFAGDYREDYGSAEFGDMACDCERRNGLHVFMDLFLIEIARNGKPVCDGEVGKVLITDLSNRAMPMIRYEIGDVGRMMHEPCGCGRSSPRLWIDGRVQDTIVTGSGRIIPSDAILDWVYSRSDIDDFQLVEKRPGVFEATFIPASSQAIQPETFATALADFLGDGAKVRAYQARTIRPEESGKFRFVKSCTYDRLG